MSLKWKSKVRTLRTTCKYDDRKQNNVASIPVAMVRFKSWPPIVLGEASSNSGYMHCHKCSESETRARRKNKVVMLRMSVQLAKTHVGVVGRIRAPAEENF